MITSNSKCFEKMKIKKNIYTARHPAIQPAISSHRISKYKYNNIFLKAFYIYFLFVIRIIK